VEKIVVKMYMQIHYSGFSVPYTLIIMAKFNITDWVLLINKGKKKVKSKAIPITGLGGL
jgi:hypothetical protein